LTAEYFGRQIAIRFERCQGCDEGGTETVKRGNLAASYEQEYAFV